MSAYYLIRIHVTNEVYGILSESAVFLQIDYDYIRENELEYFGIKAKLERIASENVGIENGCWCWEEITQAEYETYRDLYGFRVFVRNP